MKVPMPKLDIKQALAQATAAHTPVIVVLARIACGDAARC